MQSTSVSDPDPVGSVRIRIIWPDTDPDPLQETLIRIRVAKKEIVIQINQNYFFQRNHFFCLIYVNNKLKITKKNRYEFYTFYRKKLEFVRF